MEVPIFMLICWWLAYLSLVGALLSQRKLIRLQKDLIGHYQEWKENVTDIKSSEEYLSFLEELETERKLNTPNADFIDYMLMKIRRWEQKQGLLLTGENNVIQLKDHQKDGRGGENA